MKTLIYVRIFKITPLTKANKCNLHLIPLFLSINHRDGLKIGGDDLDSRNHVISNLIWQDLLDEHLHSSQDLQGDVASHSEANVRVDDQLEGVHCQEGHAVFRKESLDGLQLVQNA